MSEPDDPAPFPYLLLGVLWENVLVGNVIALIVEDWSDFAVQACIFGAVVVVGFLVRLIHAYRTDRRREMGLVIPLFNFSLLPHVAKFTFEHVTKSRYSGTYTIDLPILCYIMLVNHGDDVSALKTYAYVMSMVGLVCPLATKLVQEGLFREGAKTKTISIMIAWATVFCLLSNIDHNDGDKTLVDVFSYILAIIGMLFVLANISNESRTRLILSHVMLIVLAIINIVLHQSVYSILFLAIFVFVQPSVHTIINLTRGCGLFHEFVLSDPSTTTTTTTMATAAPSSSANSVALAMRGRVASRASSK